MRLVDETVKLLKITPRDIPDSAPEAIAIKNLLQNMKILLRILLPLGMLMVVDMGEVHHIRVLKKGMLNWRLEVA